MDKKRLRTQFKEVRRGLDAPDPDQLAVHIERALPENLTNCAAYLGFGDELDLRPALAKMPQFQWCYPKVHGDDLKFYKTEKLSGLPKNQWGIEEPDPSQCEEVSLENCQAILIPGVSFDRQGGRLGSGAGFYDRALANFKGLKIGVAFAAQVSEELLPLEDHDVRMDIIVTELYVLRLLQ